ncbi:hypothetical protein K439DRAFT_1639334 [Ramaria rubella]|nr:hypothetical protein K439DRAFT_1639334 [Ramaria rubella]
MNKAWSLRPVCDARTNYSSISSNVIRMYLYFASLIMSPCFLNFIRLGMKAQL